MSQPPAPDAPAQRRSRWQWLKDAFSLESAYGPLTDDDVALLDRIARFVVRRRMTAPAVLFLESVRPLNYVGSQAMTFFQPIVKMLFAGHDYTRLQQILERRESIEVLVQRIELAESEASGRPAQHRHEAPATSGTEQESEG